MNLGAQLRPWSGVTLGLRRVERLRAFGAGGAPQTSPAAQLSLGIGQVFLVSDVFSGQVVWLGGAALRVLAIDPGGLDFRWLKVPGDTPPVVRATRGLRLEEGALYRLPSGAVLGVGSVVRLAKSDATGTNVVTLTHFPPGYADNPLQDFQLLPRLVAGLDLPQIRELELRLAEVRPAGAKGPGWVRFTRR